MSPFFTAGLDQEGLRYLKESGKETEGQGFTEKKLCLGNGVLTCGNC